jgi:hypothetical protein
VNGLLRQGFRSAWGWPSVDGRGNSTAIDREALFQENAKACKKMPRLARKCQGGSGLRRSRKIAQLNSAYRLVKKEHTLKKPKCEHRCENF